MIIRRCNRGDETPNLILIKHNNIILKTIMNLFVLSHVIIIIFPGPYNVYDEAEVENQCPVIFQP